ncbi:regulatory-associated protein of mTOR isoform X1 [Lates japonicus]|uniref:Regulatory-associated protein of mTOR isoform X1 n=1 Tax=Lates japonicus TaxID=270547 RepID=A0AAD3NKL7_LATJO|nr:regulatory-associated protein of mTOR isoform X1 [Lates japonicus]
MHFFCFRQAWDLAEDICLSQLPTIIEEGTAFRHSPFFAEQLTAFQVWLTMGVENRNPPEQLPIVLQVLLSQVHRLRALDLLGRFLDLGPWAVSLALSVGIFPYVLKLLQSSARELRPLLVFIWAKILAVDSSCQADLVKDNGHKYFLSVLADNYMPAEHRTMAVFILAVIVNSYNTGQEACLQGNLIANCLEQLSDPHPLLRQWVAICLGRIWQNFDPARWCGVRDSAHEKLYTLLSDPIPEVRGTFVRNSAEEDGHSTTIDLALATVLAQLINDSSPVVRKGGPAAFSLVTLTPTLAPATFPWGASKPAVHPVLETIDKIDGCLVFFPQLLIGVSFNSVYTQIWRVLLHLAADPFPEVSDLAMKVLNSIAYKATMNARPQRILDSGSLTQSAPASPTSKGTHIHQAGGSPPMPSTSSSSLTNEVPKPPAREQPATRPPYTPTLGGQAPHSHQFPRTRKMFDKGPEQAAEDGDEPGGHRNYISPALQTGLCDWSAKYFAQPVMKSFFKKIMTSYGTAGKGPIIE